jgi:hypothetical protein
MLTSRFGRAVMAGSLAAALVAIASPASATPSHSTDGPKGHSRHPVSVKVFAAGSATQSQPDDIARLGSHIYVAWQNNVGPDGSPSPTGVTNSTLVEYQRNGSIVQQWSLPGHIDGLAGDPAMGAVIVTTNEDANSSLLTVDPDAPTAAQVHQYQYVPNPLPHGGGTDAISIYRGSLLISASNPTGTDVPAVYRVTLTGSTAQTTPVFFDNSMATVANVNAPDRGQPVTLALTDPDSNEVVPGTSPRFQHDFVLDSQGDEQQIYVKRALGAQPKLSLLRLSQSIDDTAWVTDRDGTLYVSDSPDNKVFAVRGDFRPGTALVAVTPGNANTPVNAPNYLGRLDLWTGQITPVLMSVQAKGLLFVS